MDHRLHLEAAFDYDHNNGVGDVFTRSWGRQGYQILSNPCPLATPVTAACPGGGNGQAQQLSLPNVRYSTLTNGGIILNTALKGTQFGPGGVPMAFQYGNYAGSSNMQGGDPVNLGNNINTGVSVEDWVKRQVAYGRMGFDINDSTTFHIEGSYSAAAGGGQSLPPRDTGALVTTISRDNPFLPARPQRRGHRSPTEPPGQHDLAHRGGLRRNGFQRLALGYGLRLRL
jgi:hypothetical protein